MGFWTAEEVLVPARFLALTAHFIAVVTILMDKDVMKASITRLRLPMESSQQLTQLISVLYAAIACLAVEYVGLFRGTSLFMRGHNCIYIILHIAGAGATGLLYTQGLPLAAYVAAFAATSVLPVALEALTTLVTVRLAAAAVEPRRY